LFNLSLQFPLETLRLLHVEQVSIVELDRTHLALLFAVFRTDVILFKRLLLRKLAGWRIVARRDCLLQLLDGLVPLEFGFGHGDAFLCDLVAHVIDFDQLNQFIDTRVRLLVRFDELLHGFDLIGQIAYFVVYHFDFLVFKQVRDLLEQNQEVFKTVSSGITDKKVHAIY